MGYRSDVGAIVSVDKNGKRPTTMLGIDGKPMEGYDYFHTDADKALFKELVGKMKLIMGHHLDESFDEDIGWYDCKIMLHCRSSKWYPDYKDVQAWNDFWHMASEMEGVSGVFARAGEEDGDLEHEEFGENPLYDYCRTVQYVQFDFETNKRVTDEEGQTTQDASNTATPEA